MKTTELGTLLTRAGALLSKSGILLTQIKALLIRGEVLLTEIFAAEEESGGLWMLKMAAGILAPFQGADFFLGLGVPGWSSRCSSTPR